MADFEPVSSADQLRDLNSALLADARTESTAVIRLDSTVSKITLQDRHDDIRQFVLSDAVPHDVRVHFETAKNLYLYAWFVYRFFPVSEKHALATLEFALRERLAILNRRRYGTGAKRRPTLAPMLKTARACGLISNEGLRSYHRSALQQARARVSNEASRELIESGAEFVEYDPESAAPLEQDYSWDALETYLETLPVIRNMYAHGSSNLHASVLGTFEIVTDLVNQLFPVDDSQKST